MHDTTQEMSEEETSLVNKSRSPWPLPVLTLVAVLVVVLLCGILYGIKSNGTEKSVFQETGMQLNALDAEAPYQNSADDSTNVVSNEVDTSGLLHIDKAGARVVVSSKEEGKLDTVLFTYNETYEKDERGNIWTYLDHNARISPDATSIAYAAEDGLYIYHVLEGTSELLQLREHMYDPRWSSDMKYIAYDIGLPEGAHIGVFDVVHNTNVTIPQYADFVLWHPREPVLILFSNFPGYFTAKGLYVIDFRDVSLGTIVDPETLPRALDAQLPEFIVREVTFDTHTANLIFRGSAQEETALLDIQQFLTD